MSKHHESWQIYPQNVCVATGSKAEEFFRGRAAINPNQLAPGLTPTREHDLIYHGGKIIPDLVYTNFYMGGAQSWLPSDIQSIDRDLAAAMSDPNLNNVIAQYFFGKQVTTIFKPSTILNDAAPSVFSKGDVELLVKNLFAAGTFQGYALGNTVFNFLMPRGTILTSDLMPLNSIFQQAAIADFDKQPLPQEEASSRQGLGGYHGSVHVTKQNTVYYSANVYSEVRPDGTRNGIPAFDTPWKNVVATLYHELNEARTDPDGEDAIRLGNQPGATHFLGWTSMKGEEIGDFPIFEARPLALVFKEVPLANGNGTVPIQLQYSNAVHGPEGPISQPH